MQVNSALANISRAKQALANARDITVVLDIRDAAVAAHAYATARNADEAAQMAMEIKLRSERKAGEFLQETELSKGGRPSNNHVHVERSLPTLKDLGINQMESKRWQHIAKIPEERFETYILSAAKRSQSALLKLARRLEDVEEEILPSEWDQIIREFFENKKWLRSFVDYPNRGPFGSETFRGNASGWLLAQLIRHFEPEVVFDPMEGSGTSGDVCNAMKIKYVSNDLKNPDGYDLINVDEELLPINCLTYLHPPYHNIIKYSDNPNDLSNQPTYGHFLKKLYVCIDKLLPKTRWLILLVGDIFDKETFEFNSIGGDTYNEYKERIIWRLIKTQHSVSSGFADYALKARNPHYIPLRHEDVLILKGDLSD